MLSSKKQWNSWWTVMRKSNEQCSKSCFTRTKTHMILHPPFFGKGMTSNKKVVNKHRILSNQNSDLKYRLGLDCQSWGVICMQFLPKVSQLNILGKNQQNISVAKNQGSILSDLVLADTHVNWGERRKTLGLRLLLADALVAYVCHKWPAILYFFKFNHVSTRHVFQIIPMGRCSEIFWGSLTYIRLLK